MNRADRRRMMHDMRHYGCTCRPDVIDIDPPPGSVIGAVLDHDRDCALVARFGDLNAAGIFPTVVSYLGPRCQR